MRRSGGFISGLVFIWLLIGVFATWQRDYFTPRETSCATGGSIALTVLVGPLNYFGVNPKIEDCNLPQLNSSGVTSSWQEVAGR